MLFVWKILISSTLAAGANVSVFKYDGSKQCDPKSGTKLTVMKKELKGIKVYKSFQQSDGNMYASVCGGATGLMNVYEIAEKDLNKAEKLGFKRLTTH